MIKTTLTVLLFFLLPVSGWSQLTISIETTPDHTPIQDQLYLAGTPNNWNPADENFSFTNIGNGKYTLTITSSPGNLEYKITRGGWPSVEADENGNYRPNRNYNYTGGTDTLTINIEGWEDLNSGSGSGTAAENVYLMDNDFFIPQLNRSRNIWIYLPSNYYQSSERYPVIYAQDGQNLFDQALSFSGEWEIDESLNLLFDQGDAGAIVVGIDNGGGSRIDEYSPWTHPQYGGGEGDAYAAFLVETLKPFIDQHYRTRPEREATAILGSSMGGLIAMYTAVEYQEIFGKAGIFSPSFWFSDQVYTHVTNTGKTAPMRFYLLAGEQEDNGSVVADNQQMYNTLIAAGFLPEEINLQTDSDGQHSEWYWRREFPDAYQWLCAALPTPTARTVDFDVFLFPNPVTDLLKIRIENFKEGLSYQLLDIKGSILLNQPLSADIARVDTSGLNSGIYFLQIFHNSKLVLTKDIIKH